MPCSQICAHVAKLKEYTMATKGGREKIKLESTAWYRSLLHDQQKQENHARENVDHEI
jgi:hypothetical protein